MHLSKAKKVFFIRNLWTTEDILSAKHKRWLERFAKMENLIRRGKVKLSTAATT